MNMKSPKPQQTVSALHEILKWSADRPEWQRDALRRIVVKGTVDETDIKELHQLCCSKHKATQVNAAPVQALPLDASHIPPGPGSEASVTLVSISNLQGVNRLPSDQTIPFGSGPGLTVIYGDNGAGKSGYARVIKKACRTRGAPPEIRPNAFLSAPTKPATGTIACRVAGEDRPPLPWQDGVSCDPLLANVFVFDASTADHYLEQDSPAVFTPSGLDVLPKLSKTCDIISQLIKDDIARVKIDIGATAKNWKHHPSTSVGKLLAGLGASTKPSQVDILSGLDEKQARRLKDVTEALKSDPKQKAKETRAAAARLRTFAGKVSEVCSNLSSVQTSALRKLVEDAESTDKVAKAFAAERFDMTYLPGTGEEVWRTLWEAARSFSVSSAYKDQPFPVAVEGARCVLCQQNLEPLAAERLRAFDAFCKDKSQEIAEQAIKRLKDGTEKVQKMNTLTPEYSKIAADLMPMTQDQIASTSAFVKSADECLETTKDNLLKTTWVEPAQLLPSPADALTTLATDVEARATTEESAEDPEIRKKLEAERDDLTDRDWLARTKPDVLDQIERHRKIAVLKKCQNDTSTAQITVKNSELTKALVTDAFCEQFKTEARGLGLRTVAVKLQEMKGAKGETSFGLRLEGSTTHTVRNIASEGEQRCIALAAFLAELSQASHQSALVFDDPVSSFDHHYREKTAARLGQESKARQVIVFTHDVVFLNDLETFAKNASIPVDVSHLEWNGNIPGQCIQGLPWDWKSADDRFDKLEKEQKTIAKDWSPVPNEDNVKAMRRAYSWLRATLERVVEKEIFCDVVFRFRSYVNVKNLNGVVGFAAPECGELQRLYRRCSEVTDAHDPSGKQAAVCDPTDLSNDIESAKKLLADIRKRKKTTVSGSVQSGTH